jgi:phage-related minor tail protein
MYADESGNIYDTATGKMMFPGRSGVTTFASPKVGDTVGGGTKTAENAAKRLADRTKEQLIVSKQLIETEKLRLNVNKAGSPIEKAKEQNLKIQGETQKRYNDLLRKSLSDQERDNIMTAKRIAKKADEADGIKRITAATKEQNKELAEKNRQIYAEAGLLDVLTEKRQAALAGAFTGGTATGTFRTDVDLMPELTGGKLGSRIEELRKELETLADPINQIIAGAAQIGTAFSESFTGLINGSMTAQESLAGFFRNIGNYFLDMASKMIGKYIEMQIIGLAQKFLPGMFGGIFGASGPPDFSGSAISVPNQYSYSAKGNVFAQNGIVPFANGGIVDRPMMFPFAKGIGLMGEAGPEAIMPLKRGADGKLGVAGGGGTSVTVNVDASGSSVQGDKGQSAALGRAIAASVQAELVKQKRPGGLLA